MGGKIKSTDIRNRDYYTEKLDQETQNYGYRWLKVACLIPGNPGRFLLMREARKKQFDKDGKEKWVEGDGGWNLPAGRVNIGETIYDAVLREVREETGRKVKLTGLCQIGIRTSMSNPYGILTFTAEIEENLDDFDRKETIQTGFFTVEQIESLKKAGKLRSPHLVQSAIDNYLQGLSFPLNIIRNYS